MLPSTSDQQTTAAPAKLRLRPFRAVRYAGSDPAAMLAPPYDVIDTEQRAELAARDPRNVVRLILPEDDGDRYTAAATLFDEWLATGVLAVDDRPALYVYQQSRDDRVLQRGMFGAVVWQPLDAGVILPHENVRPGPVQDRLALMRAMAANPEPIFLLYEGGGAASKISADAVGTPSLLRARTSDGIVHELWSITDPAALATIEADLADRRAMIADGHHRYTTYGYLRDELRGASRGAGPWDAGLALLVDESVAEPDIRAIHRAVPGLSLADATARAGEVFDIRTLDGVTETSVALDRLAACAGPAFVVSDGAHFLLLVNPDAGRLAAAKPTDRTPEWWRLDASIASVLLMEQLWGVTDAAGRVEAEHEPAAALRIARQTGGVALFLKAAPLSGIVAVAEAGDAMPRKSTLFLPKPASGVVMRAFRFES
jgi:uncharacterized protein (DUF1015 family)